MRILHVVPYFPPDRIGGVGEVAFHLHRGLLAAGHDSHVVTVGTTKDDPTVERIAESPLGWVIKVGALGRLAAEFDVVHCHQGEALALAVAMRALRVRTPLLTTFHMSYAEFERACRPYRIEGRLFGRSFGNWRYRTFATRLHRVTDWAVLRLADGTSFIARSSALDVLGERTGSVARVIHNALPPLDTAPPGSARREGMLFVGNLTDPKRSLMLPFVLKEVREQLPQTRLTIVGVEPERAAALVALFEQLGQSAHVDWAGRLRAKEITPLYQAARVLVVPSAAEGLPMVILEALRSGTPCVATRVSGHPEAIEDGVNGFLVKVDEPRDMAARCLEILNDEALAARMGEAGRRIVGERFTLGRQVGQYLALYGSLVRGVMQGGTTATVADPE